MLKFYSNDWLNDSLSATQSHNWHGKWIVTDKWRDVSLLVHEVEIQAASDEEVMQQVAAELETRRSIRNVMPILGMVCRESRVLAWTEVPDAGTLQDLAQQAAIPEWDLFMIMRDIFLALVDLANENYLQANITPSNIYLRKSGLGVQSYTAKLMGIGFPFSWKEVDQNYLPPNSQNDAKKYVFAWASVYMWSITQKLAFAMNATERDALMKSFGVSADIRNLVNSCLLLDATARWDYGEVMFFMAEYVKREMNRRTGMEVRATDEESALDTSRHWTGNHQKTFKNGDCYVGEWLEGKFHGKGIYSWLNGTSYEGQFMAGMPHGSGVFTFAEGSSYEGNIVTGQMEGEGTYTFSNRDVYKGKFQQDYMWGRGIYLMSGNHQAKYQGSFQMDKFYGQGTITKQGLVVYEGEFKYGMYHGEGMKHYANGDSYSGSFRMGMKAGRGVYQFANGDKFEGYYVCGKKDGQGVFLFSNGNYYKGSFTKGLKSGYGELCLHNKYTYIGNFYQDKFEGQGMIQYWRKHQGQMTLEQLNLVVPVDEDLVVKYEGSFANGKKSGEGCLTYSNGAVYNGHFLNDVRHGHGTYSGPDGCSYTGHWQSDLPHGAGKKIDSLGSSMEGNFVYGRMEGIFKVRYSNGDIYTGDMRSEVREGKGIMQYSNGTIYSGDWKNDCFEGDGEITTADGVKSAGEWKGGKRHGSIVTTWSDGKRFEGQYDQDKKHGLGIYYMPDGKVIKKSY